MKHLASVESLGLKVVKGELLILDQTLLPHQEVWVSVKDPIHMSELIKDLKVRGAPLIGVAAALSLAHFVNQTQDLKKTWEYSQILKNARPTAVNLTYCVDRVLKGHTSLSASEIVNRAYEIFHEDVLLCKKLSDFGAERLPNRGSVLTHCNAGGLATVGIGTAVGVIRRAFEMGKKLHVYVDETRPLLQGARLTAWELGKLGIPHTLITDSMAAFLMQQKKIDCVVVGADRIAKNRDFANKIGTYSLAVNAHFHKISFYVAAPFTTVDENCPTGKDILIEERAPFEIKREWAPHSTAVYNPAFDVTPFHLVTEFFIA